MGAGLPAEDLGFKSPLCRYQLTKYLVRQNVGLHLDPVVGVCKGTFLGKLVASLYEVHSLGHVFMIGGVVYLLKRKHT